MIPIFTSPGDEIPSRRRAMKAVALGTAVTLVWGVILAAKSSWSGVVIGVVVALVASVALGVWVSSQRENTEKEKAKRGLDGLDMYVLIDRLVDEIDDDEAHYLRRRLDERENVPQREVAASIEELLDKRAQDKSR